MHLIILWTCFLFSFAVWLILHIIYWTVHGIEYAFGAHDYPTSGVFEVDPRKCPGFKFRKSIFTGTTCLNRDQVREFTEHQSASYNGDTYHLIAKNCNHFCEDICYKLTGKHIPKWVNRLAKIGRFTLLLIPLVLKYSDFYHCCVVSLYWYFQQIMSDSSLRSSCQCQYVGLT